MTLVYCIITAVLSSVITIIAPHIVAHYRRLKTRKQQQLRTLIATEIAKQLKDIISE